MIRPSETVKASTRDRTAGLGRDEAGRAVDDRRVRHAVGREELGAGRHRSSALDELQRAAAVVGAQDDVGVQHRQQALEVAAVGRGQERVDDLPVGDGRVAVRALDTSPCP